MGSHRSMPSGVRYGGSYRSGWNHPANGFYHGARNGFRFRNRCYGCVAYGYPYYGFYDPYWWWDSYPAYNESDERERALASDMNAENLEQQRDLREAEGEFDEPTSRAHERSTSIEVAQSGPPTVLVFKDHHKREIENYAIVGEMLWNITPQRTEKIPLSQIDVSATTKANDDRGVDFHLPTEGEGQ